MVYQYFSTDWW